MNTTFLDRLAEPFARCLTAEAARKIAALKTDDAMQARVEAVVKKANRGTLTGDERAEYDRYLAAYHFVTIMQAKGRRLLPE